MLNELTKIDLKAIKTADDHVIMHRRGKGRLRCVKRAKEATSGDPFASETQYYDIENGDSIFTCYNGPENTIARVSGDDTLTECDFHPYGDAWSTIIKQLKPGDCVWFHWIADAFSNGYVRHQTSEYLHCDEVHMIVDRKLKSGKIKRWTFILGVSICPNNSARMIRGIEYTPKQSRETSDAE